MDVAPPRMYRSHRHHMSKFGQTAICTNFQSIVEPLRSATLKCSRLADVDQTTRSAVSKRLVNARLFFLMYRPALRDVLAPSDQSD